MHTTISSSEQALTENPETNALVELMQFKCHLLKAWHAVSCVRSACMALIADGFKAAGNLLSRPVRGSMSGRCPRGGGAHAHARPAGCTCDVGVSHHSSLLTKRRM